MSKTQWKALYKKYNRIFFINYINNNWNDNVF